MNARRAPRSFDAQDVTIAFGVAMLAQLLFVAVFSMPSPPLVQADISNDNAQPIAVAITPVLKLGSKTPTKIPSVWERKRPVAAKSQPQAALPSTQAEKTPEAIPTTNVPDASVSPAPTDSTHLAQPNLTIAEDASTAAAPSASTEGSEQGAVNGTETDPLKARAADMYRAQLQAWFAARFDIRGKIPFDRLKALHARALISVGSDRQVTSFTITQPSGDPTFDAAVRATLSQIQSTGVELPAPPPMYPDILGSGFPVGFQCTLQSTCE
ncbi:MAG TPA: hypothetical protein VEK07_22560 [Polyangiaceae bacterium]|nr:hypothetical protein [Polyangiaceae bacterium]